ncbi:MAG: AAA family ATPase [Candidatus Woesebacteria bacterium]|nr:MAG: AAA family ATPase [Candidatus Woesebacteria bacterium]
MDNAQNQLSELVEKIKSAQIPDDLRTQVNIRLDQLAKLTQSQAFLPEYDRLSRYIDWIANLPWFKLTQDNLDLDHARKVLESHHFGLVDIKERILEYISVLKLKGQEKEQIGRAPILCFVGLVGTGKTTIAYSIAEALGRQIARIPFGGMGDPLDLRGQSRMHPEAEPGKIIKALRVVQSKNPVILLDEIDRVTEQGRSSIMGVLVELLDPTQNKAFVDHYIDYPFDLSQALFIATANNTINIATAVMDRIEPLALPSYTDEEKITIAKTYTLPRVLKEAGIKPDAIVIDDDVWKAVVRPFGFDAGIRTLERTIEGLVRKVAKMVVEGQGAQFHITKDNVKQFLPQ